jgi:hypothetical protein
MRSEINQLFSRMNNYVILANEQEIPIEYNEKKNRLLLFLFISQHILFTLYTIFLSLPLFCCFYYSIAMSTLIRGCYILPISIESIISCELALSATHINTYTHLSRKFSPECVYVTVRIRMCHKIQFEMSNRLKATLILAISR